ncbi:type-1 angiotensin II receptor-like [Amphiura filiformis]|uniref:type-1 angiotensin II receptor-like n=1 Tax=Amphiura filiformis TaxID=82378 RepID=UPI003B21B262
MDGPAIVNVSSASGLRQNENLHPYAERVVIGVIYLFICIFGTVGNFLVIIAVLLSRKLQTPPNAFVVNLATADLIACLSFIWNVVAMLIPNGWPLPNTKWMCTLAAFINILILPGADSFRLYGIVLVYANSSINPIIYARRHPHFKVVFSALIECRYQNIPEPTGILKRFSSRRINPIQ